MYCFRHGVAGVFAANFPFSIDGLNPAGTATVMSDAFEHWVELCGMPTGFNEKNCEIAGKYPPPTAGMPPPAPITPPPSSDIGATLPSCKDYETDSLRCNQKVTAFGFDNQRQALQDERDAALKACAQTMCSTLGGGKVYEQVSMPRSDPWERLPVASYKFYKYFVYVALCMLDRSHHTCFFATIAALASAIT